MEKDYDNDFTDIDIDALDEHIQEKWEPVVENLSEDFVEDLAQKPSDEWENAWTDEDFVDIDPSEENSGLGPAPEEIFERPIRRVEQLADDPFADHDGMEDVTSGRYERKSNDDSYHSKGFFSHKKSLMAVIIACLAVIAILLIAFKLISGGDGTSQNSDNESADVIVWVQDGSAEVVSLVNQYYAALIAVDIDTLESILDSTVEINEAQLTAEAEVIEEYQDIVCYVIDGVEAGEYAVYISYNMKFVDIDTPAPGLIPAYVRVDVEGNLRLVTWDVAKYDSTISSFISTVATSETIQNLAVEVQAAYQEAYNSDESLAAFMDSISGTSSSSEEESEEETTTAAETTATEETITTVETTETATTEAAESTTQASTTAEESSEITFTETDTIMYTQVSVKCRVSPSTSDNTEYTLVESGTRVHVIGTGGKWSKVYLPDGTLGYIVTEYLGATEP